MKPHIIELDKVQKYLYEHEILAMGWTRHDVKNGYPKRMDLTGFKLCKCPMCLEGISFDEAMKRLRITIDGKW